MTERNYAREMRDLIDQETSEGPYTPSVVARGLIEKLMVTDPELLTGWLLAGAQKSIVDAIGTRDRSQRAHTRLVAGRQQFLDAVDSHEKGNTRALADWLNLRFTAADGTRKRFGDLRRDDLNRIAEGYEDQVRRLRFEAAFMRALAEKLGDQTVSEVFTDEQITKLRQSMGL